MTEQSTQRLIRAKQSDLQSSDLLRQFSQKFGGDVAVSLGILLEYLQANLTTSTLTTQYEAPTATGFSVTIAKGNCWLVLTPNAAYAAGTLVLPTGADGQEVLVICTQDVTALTVTPAAGNSAVGAPTGLTANGFFRMRFDGTLSRWYRVG